MKRFIPLIIGAIAIGASAVYGAMRTYPNPDPNHIHADFAVWIDGTKLDFSAEEFMSGEYMEGEPTVREANTLRKFVHLHDGNGDVVHGHKPGLTFDNFLESIGFSIQSTSDGSGQCLITNKNETHCDTDGKEWMFMVNGQQYVPTDGTQLQDVTYASGYVFKDDDKILLSYGSNPSRIETEWNQMTNDACLYSRICRGRGEPPTENCIADPTVPCVAR